MNEDTFKLAIIDEFQLYIEGTETENQFLDSLKQITEQAIDWGETEGWFKGFDEGFKHGKAIRRKNDDR